MNKTTTLKGFRDFMPDKMRVRNEVLKRLRNVFEKYGFDEIQTPAIEYEEVLKGKFGEDAEKLMYLFSDPGGRKVGLRYDLTVPLARVIASYPTLSFPFKRYQIQPAYRAENPQKGRYREFYQCDIDIVGSSSPLSDAEVISVSYDSMLSLNLRSFLIKINSREILYSCMENAQISNNDYLSVARSIDKLDKKSSDEVKKELSAKGIKKTQISNLFRNLKKAKPNSNLSDILSLTKKMGVNKTNIEFVPSLSRGLDYYTGMVFEITVKKPSIGSITGGGRYDNLLKSLGGPNLPAVGCAIGLERVCDIADELNLFKALPKTSSRVLIARISEETLNYSLEVASLLRNEGINCEIYQKDLANLSVQLKYANNKGIPYALILGEDELKKGKVTIKNLNIKQQSTVSLNEAIKLIKA